MHFGITMSAAHTHRGFSLIELMIGITVGMFILLGASSIMVGQMGDHRRLALETRTEQDVRVVAEVLTRELQLAGMWNSPMSGVWSEANPVLQANPNAEILVAEDGSWVRYRRWLRNDINQAEGFKLEDEVLYRLNSAGAWQPLTDPETLKITRFHVQLVETKRRLEAACQLDCEDKEDCPPSASVREFLINFQAHAAHDERVRRNFDLRIRVRSDIVTGACREA